MFWMQSILRLSTIFYRIPNHKQKKKKFFCQIYRCFFFRSPVMFFFILTAFKNKDRRHFFSLFILYDPDTSHLPVFVELELIKNQSGVNSKIYVEIVVALYFWATEVRTGIRGNLPISYDILEDPTAKMQVKNGRELHALPSPKKTFDK